MIAYRLKVILALVSRYWRVFLLGLIVGCAIILGYSKFSSVLSKRFISAKKIGVIGSFTPATMPLFIQNQLSFGLTRILDNQVATSGAAEKWEISPDGKKYTFVLRNGLSWSDSKILSSTDVSYNLAEVKIFRPDQSGIVFELSDAYAPLPNILSQPLFRPGLIGFGPYILKRFQSSGRFLSTVEIGSDQDKILYRFYPTEKIARLALAQGEVGKLVDILVKDGKPNYHEAVVLRFNFSDKIVSDKFVRQAIAYALPVSYPLGVKADGPIPPVSWAYSSTIKKYGQNLDQAKKILAKSEASDSANLSLGFDPRLESTARSISQALSSAGIKLDLYSRDLTSPTFQLDLAILEIGSDPDQYRYWHSRSKDNVGGYNSPKIDRLLEEGRRATTSATRIAKYYDFQKAMTEDLPGIFLYFPNRGEVLRAKP